MYSSDMSGVCNNIYAKKNHFHLGHLADAFVQSNLQ